MAQCCKLAGRVTNCTDNCRICLEEETKTRDIKVGDRSGISPKTRKKTKNRDSTRRKEQSESLLELKTSTVLPHTLLNGRKERPKVTVVGVPAEKTSSWFDYN